jgi:hypothetical protein
MGDSYKSESGCKSDRKLVLKAVVAAFVTVVCVAAGNPPEGYEDLAACRAEYAKEIDSLVTPLTDSLEVLGRKRDKAIDSLSVIDAQYLAFCGQDGIDCEKKTTKQLMALNLARHRARSSAPVKEIDENMENIKRQITDRLKAITVNDGVCAKVFTGGK